MAVSGCGLANDGSKKVRAVAEHDRPFAPWRAAPGLAIGTPPYRKSAVAWSANGDHVLRQDLTARIKRDDVRAAVPFPGYNEQTAILQRPVSDRGIADYERRDAVGKADDLRAIQYNADIVGCSGGGGCNGKANGGEKIFDHMNSRAAFVRCATMRRLWRQPAHSSRISTK
jgi:hypothetical protein